MEKQKPKIIYNIILALAITIAFISVEQIYRIYNDILMFNLNTKSFFEQFIIHLLIVSMINRRAIIITYATVVSFVWFQLMHFAYFGTWIFPLEYYLFFTKFQETFDTFRTVLEISIVPTTLIILLFIAITILLKKQKENKRLKIPFLSLFLIILIIFIPLRVYIKDSKKGHRPNTEYYPIKNTALNLGYLLGNIIPKKVSGHSGLEQPIVPTPDISINNPNVNVIVIMGESWHRDYMSLYNYEVDTTPFMRSLKDEDNFIYKKGISSGVVTDVGVPSFFNIIEKPDGVPQIISTNTCMFKMAKTNGFQTYFYSSQAQNQLAELKNYLCMKNVDYYQDGTSITKNTDKPTSDDFLINKVKDMNFDKPTFLAMQFRAAHTPFKDTYTKKFEKFTKENSDKKFLQNTIEYHNALNYIDFTIQNIIEEIKKKTDRPTYIVLTSDHATNLGDPNRQGHGRLDYDSVYQIPFFVYGINGAENLKDNFSEFPYISHYQAGKVVSYILGYKKENEAFNTKADYYVCDSDISGLSGMVKLSFDENNNQIPKLIE